VKSWQRKLCMGIALCLAGGWSAQATPPVTQSRAKTTAARKTHSAKKRSAARTATRRKTTKKTRRVSRRHRRLTRRQIRARLHLQPDRIEEIQQALSKAGYLKEEPTGHWDEATRSGMSRYQADHGFPVTGLPEAKSLMKLGLGPHSLPPDLDPGVAARASVESPDSAPAQEGASRQGGSPNALPDNKQ
jgi:peptidoglycan hydrolase-like protein with peptidoglycan-binding domain